MSFTQAISDGFRKYVVFSGRSSRSAYWYWTLFMVILSVVAYAISIAADSMVINNVVSLATLLPSLAVSVRRLHDVDRSGWWVLLGLIPLLGWLVLLYWAVQPSDGPNKYGEGPDTTSDSATVAYG